MFECCRQLLERTLYDADIKKNDEDFASDAIIDHLDPRG